MYEYYTIYGPYTRKDGRQHVILYKDGKRRTISYPKFLMEQHLGRQLEEDETVDHKDCDFTNNDLDNLRVIERAKHASEDAKRLVEQAFVCPECGKEFSLSGKKLHDAIYNRKRNRPGPFCGKPCAGRHNAKVQRGMKPLEVKQIIPEYTTDKSRHGGTR
jgi:transcription elongation factor Elf1